MIGIAIAICLESGRPVVFAHRRVGHQGRTFRVYKFRKFHRNCSDAGLQLTLANDARFTRLGRLLASAKLDELSQFWNVLSGDMSIVGPRPESLQYLDCFKGEFAAVLNYKPGIFGPSQAAFRHESVLFPKHGDLNDFYRSTLFPVKARMDLSYYPHRTLTSDLWWLLRGLAASLRQR